MPVVCFKNKIFPFIIFILLLCAKRVNAQFADLKFEQLTADHGLSNNVVLRTLRTNDNYLWIATQKGLNRYNGSNIQNYFSQRSDTNSLSSSFITTLMQDKDEQLWVGTVSGLNLYNKNLNNFKRFTTDNQGNNIGFVRQINQNEKGDIWVLTNNKLYSINTTNKKKISIEVCKTLDLMPRPKFTDMYIDNNNYIWIVGHNKLLYRFNINTNELWHTTIENTRTKNLIKCIIGNNNGLLWIGSNGDGLTMYNTNTQNFYNYPLNLNGTGISGMHIRDLYIKNNKYLYISVEQSGINRLDLKKETLEYCLYNENNTSGLSKDALFSVYIDKENILYASTYNGGVNIYNPNKHKFKTVRHIPFKKNSLVFNVIKTFFEDSKGNLWIGTDGGGVSKYNPKTDNFSNYKYDPINPKNSKLYVNDVLSITEDKYNNILVSTWNGGINVYNEQKDSFEPILHNENDSLSIPHNRIYSMFTDEYKNTWIAPFRKGLMLFDVKKGVTIINIPNNNDLSLPDTINRIINIPNNKLGLFTSRGYIEFDINTYKLCGPETFNQQYDHTNTLHDAILDSRGNYWFASFQSGLIMHNKDTTIYYCNTKEFPAKTTYCIIEDKYKNIWVSTSEGISCYNTTKKTFQNYDLNDGLQGKQFIILAKYITNNGTIFFGGYNGYNYFNPDDILINGFIPDIEIDKIEVTSNIYSNKLKDITKYLNSKQFPVLEYNQKNISFSFTAIHHTNPQKCKYAYKLAGYDSIWIETKATQRQITYTNLNPGKYTFLVKCSNNDGVWNNTPKSFFFEIKKPFWQSKWFYFLCFIILFSIIVFFHKLRLQNITTQKNILEKNVALRTFELNDANTKLEEQHEELKTQKVSLIDKNKEIENAYNELNNYKNNLESLVEKRTEELSKAKIKAEESDKLKTSFLANLSHEVRTPLNAIVGFTDIIISEDIDEESKIKFGRIIETSSKTLTTLIDDILDISRIEAGQLKINMQASNISYILSAVVDSYRVFVKKENKNIDIKLNISDEILRFEYFSDEQRLIQILNNLIDNAIKFTPIGTIIVNCNTDFHKNKIWFLVKDNGIGIETKYFDKIFERFFKIEDQNTILYRGAGLGLPICKKLVELMGGNIFVSSTLRQGSTFSFFIPLKKSDTSNT